MAESSAELTRTSIEQERIDFEQNIYLKIKQFAMQENQLMIAAKSDTVAQKRYVVTQQRYRIHCKSIGCLLHPIKTLSSIQD